MSEIQVTDKYRLSKIDDLNWAIQEATTIKDSKKNPELNGTIKWSNISYHGSLAMACTRLAKNITDEVTVQTLNEYAEVLKRQCDNLADIIIKWEAR